MKAEEKRCIRQRVLQTRNALSKEEQERAATLITDRILGHQWYYLSDALLCYAGYGSELDTRQLIQETLKNGKKVYLPKVEGTAMTFYRITSLSDLQEGYHGILEPAGDTERFVYQEETADKVLLLMPGVAFDPYRNRIGYGKGFYDRFLEDKPLLQLRSIAIGHKCQLVEEIPAEETDIRPYQVICI